MMNRIKKIFHPELFQGSLDKKNYFEGWYFKHVSKDRISAFAVIPGISLSDDRHSFIQFIEGNTGKTWYFRYDYRDFTSDENKLHLRVGNSVFCSEGIELDLNSGSDAISGKIEYSAFTKLKKTVLRPGIMGWYSYIPTMECNHGLVSMNHSLNGFVSINSEKTDLSDGRGYIEKDWGTSFPESWLWLQCNSFVQDDVSVMISVAKIPWRGHFFMGFLSAVTIGGNSYLMATYNRSEIVRLVKTNSGSEIAIRKGKILLEASVTGAGAGYLKAPSNGLMINNIRESINSSVSVRFSKCKEVLFEGNGQRAGYEETPMIFSYF